ncbi:MAG: hypothetical protein BJ554DRAFT_200, partial [Olpidium bornovanus]
IDARQVGNLPEPKGQEQAEEHRVGYETTQDHDVTYVQVWLRFLACRGRRPSDFCKARLKRVAALIPPPLPPLATGEIVREERGNCEIVTEERGDLVVTKGRHSRRASYRSVPVLQSIERSWNESAARKETGRRRNWGRVAGRLVAEAGCENGGQLAQVQRRSVRVLPADVET